MAPLVVARKGYYNELANWATARASTCCGWTGSRCPPTNGRASTASASTTSTCQWASRGRTGRRGELSDLLTSALDHGKGTVRLVESTGTAGAHETPFSTTRSCPGCGRAFEEPDPRLFSYNSKHGWCPSCFGTGVILSGFDEEQSGEEGNWLEADRREAHACPACDGRRLNPQALAVRFRDRSIADLSALSVDRASEPCPHSSWMAARRAIATDLLAEVRGRLGSCRRWGSGT